MNRMIDRDHIYVEDELSAEEAQFDRKESRVVHLN